MTVTMLRFMPPPVRAFRVAGLHLTSAQNFGSVEEDLYRCGQPNEVNFPFLERLQLKSVVFLSPEDPSQRL